ncbi:MAG: rRNA maturation RNase YbeY [Cyclobacteriaceae bacterium]
MAIFFFSEGVRFKLSNQKKSISWIKSVVKKEGGKVASLNYIFCSDEYLKKINIKYLNHHTYTDIITFDYSPSAKEIEGEIYISIDRVRENADSFKTSFQSELHRVIIHGVLHLLGYKDKSKSEKALMREKEDTYLSLLRKSK